ncbi:hypothetical protein ACS3SW_03325 [Roseobacteraceae bacterium S113]
MLDRRRSESEITPDYEDRGLFRGPIMRVEVELTPKVTKNQRGDTVIQGFVSGNNAMEVVFAGRRRELAGPLIATLSNMWSRAVQANTGRTQPSPDQVRYKVKLTGSWRSRFETDDHGWQSRRHQLMVAQWIRLDEQGNEVRFGAEPVLTQPATAPQSPPPQQFANGGRG